MFNGSTWLEQLRLHLFRCGQKGEGRKKNYLHSCKTKVNFKICKYIYIKLVIFLLLKGNGTCGQMRRSYEILFYVEGLGLDGWWWWMFLPPWPWSQWRTRVVSLQEENSRAERASWGQTFHQRVPVWRLEFLLIQFRKLRETGRKGYFLGGAPLSLMTL